MTRKKAVSLRACVWIFGVAIVLGLAGCKSDRAGVETTVVQSSVLVRPLGVESFWPHPRLPMGWGWSRDKPGIVTVSVEGKEIGKRILEGEYIWVGWTDPDGHLWVEIGKPPTDFSASANDAAARSRELACVDAAGQLIGRWPLEGELAESYNMIAPSNFFLFNDRKHALYVPGQARSSPVKNKDGATEWYVAQLIDYSASIPRITSIKASLPAGEMFYVQSAVALAGLENILVGWRTTVPTNSGFLRLFQISKDGQTKVLTDGPGLTRFEYYFATSDVLALSQNALGPERQKTGVVSLHDPPRFASAELDLGPGKSINQLRLLRDYGLIVDQGGFDVFSYKAPQAKERVTEREVSPVTTILPLNDAESLVALNVVSNSRNVDPPPATAVVYRFYEGSIAPTRVGNFDGFLVNFQSGERAWLTHWTSVETELSVLDFSQQPTQQKIILRKPGRIQVIGPETVGDDRTWYAYDTKEGVFYRIQLDPASPKVDSWPARHVSLFYNDHPIYANPDMRWSSRVYMGDYGSKRRLWSTHGDERGAFCQDLFAPAASESKVLPSSDIFFIYEPAAEFTWVGGRSTAVAANEFFSVQFDRPAPPLKVTIGGTTLEDKVTANSVVRIDPAQKVKIECADPAGLPQGRQLAVSVIFTRPNGKPLVETVPFKSPETVLNFPAEWSQSKMSVSTVISDELGGEVRSTWPVVEFKEKAALYQRPVFKAVILWFAIVIVTFATRGPRAKGSALAAFAPAVSGLIAFGSTQVQDLNADAGLFGLLCGGTMAVALITGYISPAVFRDLARIKPLDTVMVHLVRVPAVRRRVFSDYIKILRAEIYAMRLGSLGESAATETGFSAVEVYTPIPAKAARSNEAASIVEHPADWIVEAISNRKNEERCSVFVHGPGGRGKSALLRVVVERMADRFARTGSGPLPVLINARGGIEASVSEKLGESLVWAEQLPRELGAGDYLIVLDGLSEKELTPEAVASFRARIGSKIQLLITTRSKSDIYLKFVPRESDLVVEPLPLNDVSLPMFEQAYLGKGSRLSDATRAACRADDESYSPILVRLAMLDPHQPVSGLADIYRRAFDALVSRDRDMLWKAADLCLQTYWKTGNRWIRPDLSDAETVDALKRAGVLYRLRVARGLEPEVLIFFHDSMQSYLTAVGLSLQEREVSAASLLRAAGWNKFRLHRAEFYGVAGSELSQMCLRVFRRAEVTAIMRESLTRWARDHASSFAPDDIINAVPAEQRGLLNPAEPSQKILYAAIALATDENELEFLAGLYSSLAVTVFSKHSPVLPETLHAKPMEHSAEAKADE